MALCRFEDDHLIDLGHRDQRARLAGVARLPSTTTGDQNLLDSLGPQTTDETPAEAPADPNAIPLGGDNSNAADPASSQQPADATATDAETADPATVPDTQPADNATSTETAPADTQNSTTTEEVPAQPQ